MPELLCPVCGGVLTQGEKAGICSSGHSFDRAKSGYVNLLVARQSGAQHGDDKEMVRARRAFLDGGWYAPLRCALCSAAVRHTPAEDTVDLLDAGVDISKDALRWGGKRAPDLQLAVASVFRLPVAAKSCDILLNVFAPFAGEEYVRVLRPGGVLLHAAPDAMHLWELKEAVYETPYRNDAAPPVQAGLSLVEEERISTVLHLVRHEDIASLFQMTPYAHNTGPADAARLDALDTLDVTAAFVLRAYRRD